MRIGRFLGECWATFFDNATAKRDFRAQLRGPRAMWIWLGYLFVLSLITGIAYSGVSGGSTSISQAQSQLKSLYGTIINTIAALMLLILPAMTATSVIAERDRKSLDLLQSAPVSPTYLLMGKLIHAMRFGILLAALTAPFAGIAILAGGATWQEVVVHFLMILFSVSFYAAIALAISSEMRRTGPALIATFAATFLLVLVGYQATQWWNYAVMGVMGTRTAPTTVGPWFLNPFFTGMVSQYLDIYNPAVQVELLKNLGFGILAMLFVLLGAASSMSRLGATETKVFRVLGIVLCVLVTGPLAIAVSGGAGFITGPRSMADSLNAALFIPTVVLPFVFTWRPIGERKTLFDGTFNVKKILLGTPSGGIPIVLLSYLLSAATVYFLTRSTLSIDQLFMTRFFWGFGNILFVAGICGMSSVLANSIGNARGLTCVTLVVSAVLPLLTLAAGSEPASALGLFGGFTTNQESEIVTSAVLQSIVGTVLLYFSHNSAKSKMALVTVNHAKPPRAA